MADADVIVVGAGLAGLVAACELVERGRRVLIVDQENANNIGGQAFWSFGGLFFVDSPEQRRLGIRDSHELALQDWLGTAGFDRPEDHWPRQWAHAYVDFAAGEKRSWLRERGLQTFPVVGWAERGGYDARGHGNSVPRFHITWGTGPAIVDIFARRLLGNAKVRFAHRHRVDELIVENGAVVGVRGAVLEPTTAARGVASSRNTVGEFEFRASAVIVASGGIGGNHDLVRQNWPEADGPGARTAAQRGARARRRPDDRHHRIRGRSRHQQRPDVALHRGHHQLRPDLAAARHPDPARPVVAVAGRHRQAAAVSVVSRLRHARHAGIHRADRTGLHLVHPQRADHRQGVRAVRAGAEPRSHRQERARTCSPGCGQARPHRCRRSSTRGRLRQRKLLARLGVRDEHRARRAAGRLRHRGGRGDRARPRSGQPVHQGHPDRRRFAWRATTSATGSAASSPRTGSPTRRPDR